MLVGWLNKFRLIHALTAQFIATELAAGCLVALLADVIV